MSRALLNHWLAVLLSTVLWMSAPFAQTPEKSPLVYHLLILDSQLGNPYDEIRDALLEALNSYGYVEGQNLEITFKAAANDAKQGEQILRDQIRQQHYDVIFVGGTVATIAAKEALYGNMEQPVVFAAPTDPVGIGVISDFQSPPMANFTGVCYPVPVKSRLKFLRRLLPHAKTLGLIYADMPQSQSYNRWLNELLASDPEFADLKILFSPVPFVAGENGDRLMAEQAVERIKLLDPKVDVFLKPNDQMGTRQQFSQVLFKTASKPLIGIVKDDVMAHWGATAVVYPSHASIGQQAARMIKTLFEGHPINELKPEWPQKYGFAVDLTKTKQFGISVPVELLLLAGDNIVK